MTQPVVTAGCCWIRGGDSWGGGIGERGGRSGWFWSGGGGLVVGVMRSGCLGWKGIGDVGCGNSDAIWVGEGAGESGWG